MTLEQVKEIISSEYIYRESDEHIICKFDNGFGLSIIDWRLIGKKKHEILEAALISFVDESCENGYDDWELVYDDDAFQDVVTLYFKEDLERVMYEARIKVEIEGD